MAAGRIAELPSLAEFRCRRAEASGVFVVVGRPSGRVLVHHVTCPFMTDDAYRAEMIVRDGRKGRYLWAADATTAVQEFKAVRCRHPADPV